MTQDTRKDPRAKIVSLNVRYKSATVDEFIENHSHDVSKGGIFIKTSTPFPQGTLLKFEIRLSGDQAVIAGVGRVVWKREANTSGSESPAGMGVKFIKIDENSRTVIDRLVGTKANAGSAFTAELEKKGEDKTLQGLAAAAPNATLLGTGAAPTAASASSGPPRPDGPKLKSTIMGMGAVKDPAKESSSPPPAAGAGFFPPTNAEADMPPPEERTMMKQAAELLEEALKGAGGSMDEIGTNPLFAGPAAAPRAATPTPAEPKKELEGTSPPSTVRDTPLAKESAPGPISEPPPARAPVSARPAPRTESAVARVSESTPPPGKKFPAWAWAPILLVIAGGLVFALKPDLFGGGTTAVPTPTAAPSTPVSVAPIDSAPVAIADAAITAVADASALAVMAGKGDGGKDSGPTTAVVAPPVIAPPVVKPPVGPKPPPPKPPPAATPPEGTSPPEEGATTTPKPTPAPAPKKPAEDSDNPY